MVRNPLASVGDAGDAGSISGLGRAPGEENGNLFQYSCQEITWSEERGRLTVPGVAKSQTGLSN